MADERLVEGRVAGFGGEIVVRLDRELELNRERFGIDTPGRTEPERDDVDGRVIDGRLLRLELRLLELPDFGFDGTVTPGRELGIRLLMVERMGPGRVVDRLVPDGFGVVVERLIDRGAGNFGCVERDGTARDGTPRDGVERPGAVRVGVERGIGCGIPTLVEPPGTCFDVDVFEPGSVRSFGVVVRERLLDERGFTVDEVPAELRERPGTVSVFGRGCPVTPEGTAGVFLREPADAFSPVERASDFVELRPIALRATELRPGIAGRVGEAVVSRSFGSRLPASARELLLRLLFGSERVCSRPLPLFLMTLSSRSRMLPGNVRAGLVTIDRPDLAEVFSAFPRVLLVTSCLRPLSERPFPLRLPATLEPEIPDFARFLSRSDNFAAPGPSMRRKPGVASRPTVRRSPSRSPPRLPPSRFTPRPRSRSTRPSRSSGRLVEMRRNCSL